MFLVPLFVSLTALLFIFHVYRIYPLNSFPITWVRIHVLFYVSFQSFSFDNFAFSPYVFYFLTFIRRCLSRASASFTCLPFCPHVLFIFLSNLYRLFRSLALFFVLHIAINHVLPLHSHASPSIHDVPLFLSSSGLSSPTRFPFHSSVESFWNFGPTDAPQSKLISIRRWSFGWRFSKVNTNGLHWMKPQSYDFSLFICIYL